MAGTFEKDYFLNNFNTKLAPADEEKFQTWATANNRLRDLEDYDARGWWKNDRTTAGNGHGSDVYKKPNHPTFSDESMYHGTPAGNGLRAWQGGKWIQNENGEYTGFAPSEQMLKTTQPAEKLDAYFAQHEPDLKLHLPPEEEYNLAYKKATQAVVGQ